MPEPRPHLTLYVPGLLGPRGLPGPPRHVEGLALPSLERLLARAERLAPAWPDATPECPLCHSFGLSRPAGGDWPVAALTRALDGGDAAGDWHLRADPVHLRAEPHKLILFEAGWDFPLDRSEAHALAAEVNAEYPPEELRLEVLSPTRWYLRRPAAAALRTHSPEVVVGQDVDPYLPEGPDGRAWRRTLNEIQMILHASPVNQAREARGLPPVNSVWFWGGGVLPARSAAAWSGVWSDDGLAAALALHAGVPRAALPAGAARWLEVATPGAHLAVLDEGAHRARRTDLEGWREWLAALEGQWLAPLLSALGAGQLASLGLLTDGPRGWRLARSHLRRWWRRRRRTLATEIAERDR